MARNVFVVTSCPRPNVPLDLCSAKQNLLFGSQRLSHWFNTKGVLRKCVRCFLGSFDGVVFALLISAKKFITDALP